MKTRTIFPVKQLKLDKTQFTCLEHHFILQLCEAMKTYHIYN